MSLSDKFTKKMRNKCSSDVTPLSHLLPNSSANDSTEQTKEEGYYFQNVIELAIYGKYHGKDNIVSWLQGDNYISEYNRGYQLFEQGKFQEALDAYQNCLILNPIGISARFEICETYIQLRKFREAKATLFEMKDYLVEEKNIARFYRRIGYIAVEEVNFDCALAALSYSLNFEKNPSAQKEISYICAVARMSAHTIATITSNTSSVLAKHGVPILTETKLY